MPPITQSTTGLRPIVTCRFCAALASAENMQLIYHYYTGFQIAPTPLYIQNVSRDSDISPEDGQMYAANTFEEDDGLKDDPVDWSSWLTPQALDESLDSNITAS